MVHRDHEIHTKKLLDLVDKKISELEGELQLWKWISQTIQDTF